jgi:hypothetical protein
MPDAPEPANCKLCDAPAPLQGSHLIPGFVARWIKETSATGFLRGFETPNRRAQDFPTRRLLCQNCEGRFSKAENLFSQRVFKPFHEEERSTFEYDGWFLYFAVSLAWRCLVTADPNNLALYPQHAQAVATAEASMRNYLLERSARIGPYRFNLFFTPTGVTSTGPLPEGLSWYSLRGADMTPVYSQNKFATYVKLPGMFFWTSIVPPDPGGWQRTKVSRHGTFHSAKQVLSERGVFDFMLNRVETVFARISNVSPAQKGKIDDAIRRAPERVAQSRSLDAWLDDERIRAENAGRVSNRKDR